MSLAVHDLFDFLKGPGFIISIVVFLAGCVYRVMTLIRVTHGIERKNFREPGAGVNAPKHPAQGPGNLFIFFKKKIRNTILQTNPVMAVVSVIFHILLFITPVFLPAHNIIAGLTIGISLFTFPEMLMDVFTMIIIIAGVFFLARRIFIPRVRALSTMRDYFVLILVMAPFVSAFFAYHHFFNYHNVIFFHMIIGEVAIMIVPFTNIIHMPFLIFSRFFVDGEYSITTGKRSW